MVLIIFTNKIYLRELIQLEESYKNHPLDHYMFTPGTIKKLRININCSTIKAYTQATPQKIRSCIRCVLPQHRKLEAPIIKNWIVQERIYNRALIFLEVMFNITPWTEENFQK